ncbi:unnamed protein product [Prorocentrum cordatum]|uniref:PROP1-like PPR domain-containing protein n=1 Tax=Prorocentrum cordatum TaxID=2364126 RepID=A0ABN9W7S4_9DINO|nr:unnamed protein product [Polarella glacialis]
MLGIGRGSREGAIPLEASIKNCGRTTQWSAALRLLREGLRLGVQLAPGHFIATASACRKGGQWQYALSALSDMWKAKLEPNVISYSAGISACEKVSYSAGISACEKGEQWQRALALLSEMWEAKLEPDLIFSYSAGISACQKGEQWERALALLSGMWEAKLEPDDISYSAGIRACERSGQWRQALSLLSEMRNINLEPNEVNYNSGITAYERSSGHSAGFPGHRGIGLSRF